MKMSQGNFKKKFFLGIVSQYISWKKYLPKFLNNFLFQANHKKKNRMILSA